MTTTLSPPVQLLVILGVIATIGFAAFTLLSSGAAPGPAPKPAPSGIAT